MKAKASGPLDLDLDPAAAEVRRQATEYRVNVVQVPVIRAAGYLLVSLALFLHNGFLLGRWDARTALLYAAGGLVYSGLTWLVLRFDYGARPPRWELGFPFLILDYIPLTVALALSGVEKSLLFVILIAHVADQIPFGSVRVLGSGHVATLAYLVMLVVSAGVLRMPVAWPEGILKAVLVWGSGVYFGLAARPASARSDRMTAVARLARDLVRQLNEEKRLLEESRESLRSLASHDALTGLLNRSAILDIAERGLRRARHEGRSFAIVLADLDYFKDINDAFGHQTGDRVLAEAGTRFMASLRPGDAIGRYGGEEFLIALPECGRTAAAALAERLRLAISVEDVVRVTPHPVSLTCSFGAAANEPDDEYDLEGLVRAADSALYLAKKRGRNRVETGPVPARVVR